MLSSDAVVLHLGTQVGQALWCVAHTLWSGSSIMVTASIGLMAHHIFGCWHGDKRLSDKYGHKFEAVKARTSIVPFKAIIEGRQVSFDTCWYLAYTT